MRKIYKYYFSSGRCPHRPGRTATVGVPTNRNKKYFELIFWIFSLTLLAFMSPGTDPHYSLCFFKWMGIDFCPGCGLGHAISYLFHGDIKASFSSHPLGIFAVIIILFRIYKLLLLHLPKKIIYATRL